MPQTSSTEPTSLRRSPRLLQLTKNNATPQASITPKPTCRSMPNGAPPLLRSTPQISSAPRCCPTEMPLICALAASNGSDSAPSSCKTSRSGTKREGDLSHGIVGIQGVRRSPRFLSRSNLGDLVGATCVGNNNKSILGGFDGGVVFSQMTEMRKIGRGQIKPCSGPCAKKLGVMNKSGQLSFVDSPVIPFEAGEGKVRNCEVGDVKMMGKVSCNYVNGESKKRLRCSSLTDSGVEFNEEEGNVSGAVGNDKENHVSGKVGAGESGISQCYAASIGRASDCSTNKERGVIEIMAVRRSPRLLGWINSQKAANETCYVNYNLSTSCSLNSGQVAQKEGKALEQKVSMVVNGEKGEGLDAGKSLCGGTGRSAPCSDAGLANMQEVRKKKVADVKEKQGTDQECCVSTNFYATPTGKMNMQKAAKQLKAIGGKMKKKQVEGSHQGWTKEQICALQRAYFATKPTPHFWKKVAKVVPGKSAQDCFDKVNSENLTPPLLQPRSKAKIKISSPSCHFSYSPCRLRFFEPKNKRVCNGKRKGHLAQRTMRHLLEKYSQVCQGNEGDLFSVLEPNANPSNQVIQQAPPFVTSIQMMENTGSSLLRGQRSTPSHPKQLSRFSTSCGNPLISPPVLKPVKNRVLHEKYIDQLHCREAKRMATSARNVKGHSKKSKKKESCLGGNGDIVRAAKNALVSGARDAINRFQHLQVDLTETYPEFEEDCCYEDDEV